MDNFQQSCEAAYRFIAQQKRTTAKEIRRTEHFKFHEWGDILFYLRHAYGVVSIRGKGIFINEETYLQWLKSPTGPRVRSSTK